MKRIIYLSLLSFTAFILFSYSNGIFTADYTGSTGLGQSCAQIGCHTGGGTSGVDTSRLIVRVIDASNTDVNAYSLGQQYNIEMRFKLLGATKVGFQCTNLFYFTNAKAGTISNTTMPTLVQMYTDGSGREYVSHTLLGTGTAVINGGYATWKYKWTAPSTIGNAISFNCTVNKTNSNNLETGDSIFQTIKTLQIPTNVNEFKKSTNIHVIPNPATQFIDIQTDLTNIDEITVFNLFGQRMPSHASNSNSRIDVSQLVPGKYVVHLKSKEGTFSQLFMKQ
jgi:hypothetical protein